MGSPCTHTAKLEGSEGRGAIMGTSGGSDPPCIGIGAAALAFGLTSSGPASEVSTTRGFLPRLVELVGAGGASVSSKSKSCGTCAEARNSSASLCRRTEPRSCAPRERPSRQSKQTRRSRHESLINTQEKVLQSNIQLPPPHALPSGVGVSASSCVGGSQNGLRHVFCDYYCARLTRPTQTGRVRWGGGTRGVLERASNWKPPLAYSICAR